MSSSSKEEGAGVSPANKGSWSTFLRSIASFNGDLASLTAPPFILGTISLSEFSGYWAERPDIFVAPARGVDQRKFEKAKIEGKIDLMNDPSIPAPERRALLVLKWFLTTLKQQYSSRSDYEGNEKKPLNPFLGELHIGQWPSVKPKDEDWETGVTTLVSEQVSHHPPVTAYCIRNEKHGITLQGYNAQKASFSRTIHVKQIGHALLHLDEFNEDYLITIPALHIEGLIYGTPFVELNDKTYIVSSTGYISKIDYSGKGWIGGKKNSFTATLYKEGNEKHTLYSAEGQWSNSFTICNGSKKSGTAADSFVPGDITPLQYPSPENLSIWEAKRRWAPVVQAIRKGDMDTTNHEKSLIENEQRDMRKKEAAKGVEWQRWFFVKKQNDPLFDRLAKPIGERIEAEKTGGIWRFDAEHAKKYILQVPEMQQAHVLERAGLM
ncbi:Oxysterol binding protein [Xylographa soralifera]|nr:Oxysterol binding protein [Xylographa soralifera]